MMEAERLRRAFTEFFVARGHAALPPASLVPNDPTVMFTIAGMIQFKAYFLGEGTPASPRATTIQPCLRTNDIENVGRTPRHCTFFEMLGNFSFGDYFKEKAIPWGWEFVTEVLGFDPDQLWVTVHVSDDEAEEIWRSSTAVQPDRIQRLDEDNFWKMGETGPCGPSSEIFLDRGEEYGPGGGPAIDDSDRYTELWNLVFTQFDRGADGSLTPLPKRNIDTGAGLDRLLVTLQGVDHVQAIDCVAPIVERAAELTGTRREADPRHETALRVIGDHSRAFTFAVADGVFPSNEGRGYVLRRLIRRAVLRAHQLGRRDPLTPELVDSVVTTMGVAYPNLGRDSERIKRVVLHEEEAFLRTLRQGTSLLEEALGEGGKVVAGPLAFRLHDTYGLPIELTKEIAEERGFAVDEAGFEEEMAEQRRRARDASRSRKKTPEEAAALWRQLWAEHGATEFLGYTDATADAKVLAVVPSATEADFTNVDGEGIPEGCEPLEVFLDRTAFYAEGGGQVGDTGTVTTATGRFRVIDTTAVADGLTRHFGYLADGTIEPGQDARAEIDAERREAIRRNHTGTHLLHSALRRVLGDHVRQQGSLVAPDRLRFDFSHFGPLTRAEIERVEDLVNSAVLADGPVDTKEMSKTEAEAEGAIAFFGEKYGEQVRVVHAGHESVELCGGTHVRALGMIGPLGIVSEGSIGANTRRIEATTGTATLERLRAVDRTLETLAEALNAPVAEVPAAVSRISARARRLEDELKEVRRANLQADAAALAAAAEGGGGIAVARRDGLEPDDLRELALSVRNRPGVDAVGVVGSPGEGRVAIVVAASKDAGVDARAVAAEAARLVGGGGGGSPELATAGGRDVSGIDRALASLRQLLGRP